jgi:hypothetical protein
MHKSGFMTKVLTYKRAKYFLFFLCSLALTNLIILERVSAQGNLLVSPRRVVFDGTKKSVELSLANTGGDTARYLVSFKEIRMLESGSFEEIVQPDPGQNFASKYLRVFPRTVTLGPNESQSLKVQLTKTGDLQPGEYRSHIYFRALPNPVPLGETDTKKDTNISVQLVPIFGVTIPVIIREGAYNAGVTLSDLAYKVINDSTSTLDIKFNRTGTMSVYGDISVEHIADNGKVTEVGAVKGIAVYTPNATRWFSVNLNRNAGADLKKGKLHIVYTSQKDDKSALVDNKPVKLAETDYILK